MRLTRLLRSTAVSGELAAFGRLAGGWWDRAGPMAALHAMNAIRVPWIRNALAPHPADPRKPLAGTPHPHPFPPWSLCQLAGAGLRLADAGCGAGVLSEPLARLGAVVTGIDAAPGVINAAEDHRSPELATNLTYLVAGPTNYRTG